MSSSNLWQVSLSSRIKESKFSHVSNRLTDAVLNCQVVDDISLHHCVFSFSFYTWYFPFLCYMFFSLVLMGFLLLVLSLSLCGHFHIQLVVHLHIYSRGFSANKGEKCDTKILHLNKTLNSNSRTHFDIIISKSELENFTLHIGISIGDLLIGLRHKKAYLIVDKFSFSSDLMNF